MTVVEFVDVAPLGQVPLGTGNCFTVAGKGVAVFNVDGTIYAMETPACTKDRRWAPAGSTARSSPAGPTAGATT